MAIVCPRCNANYDVTLFQFGRRIRCGCGLWVDLESGHLQREPARKKKEGLHMKEEEIGRVSHYFGKISVAAIDITGEGLSVGDTIHIKGHTSDFTQVVDSMQFEGRAIEKAALGLSVGIKVVQPAREHDVVYRVTD